MSEFIILINWYVIVIWFFGFLIGIILEESIIELKQRSFFRTMYEDVLFRQKKEKMLKNLVKRRK